MLRIVRGALLPVVGLVVWLVPEMTAAQPATQPATRPRGASVTQARVARKTYDFKDGAVVKNDGDSGDAGKAAKDVQQMPYTLFVPSSYDKAKRTPLVVALHGLYSNPWQILHYPGMTDLAEKHGYIVVAPMGYNNHGWYGARPLVAGPKDDPKDLSELSEKDVMNVLGIVREQYNIDPDRIYLLGHSMGGGGVWELGIKHPELWAALAPIAPATLRPSSDVEKIKKLPVILVQGDQDILVRVERVRPWAEQMKKLGMDYEYDEVAGGDHIFTAFKALPKVFAFFDQHKRGEAAGGR